MAETPTASLVQGNRGVLAGRSGRGYSRPECQQALQNHTDNRDSGEGGKWVLPLLPGEAAGLRRHRLVFTAHHLVVPGPGQASVLTMSHGTNPSRWLTGASKDSALASCASYRKLRGPVWHTDSQFLGKGFVFSVFY